MKDISILHGDCLELMKALPDRSINMIMADLPYQKTLCSWDSIIPLDKLWEQFKRIITDNGPIVLTATQPFSSLLISSNLKWYRHTWVWDKHIPVGMHIVKHRPMQRHEDVIVFAKNRPTYNPIMTPRDKPVRTKIYKKSDSTPMTYSDGQYRVSTHKYPQSIIEGCWEPKAGRLHPTQKPVSLMEYLIKTYSNAGDTILDPTMGSGTTGIAAHQTGRKFIGMEKDPQYYKIASDRIAKKCA